MSSSEAAPIVVASVMLGLMALQSVQVIKRANASRRTGDPFSKSATVFFVALGAVVVSYVALVTLAFLS